MTAFDDPTIINIENGIKNQPKFIIKFLKNGKYKFVNSSFWENCNNPNIPTAAIKICEKSLNLNEIPEEFSNLIGLFKRHNYKVFFKRHPLKSSWSIQTWKEKFNFEKVVNGGDAVTVMQDICPSFVVGWTSTALCEASNMKIIPISLINLLDKKGIGTLDIFPIQNRSILWPSEKNMIYDVITKKTRDSYSETLEKLRLR